MPLNILLITVLCAETPAGTHQNKQTKNSIELPVILNAFMLLWRHQNVTQNHYVDQAFLSQCGDLNFPTIRGTSKVIVCYFTQMLV